MFIHLMATKGTACKITVTFQFSSQHTGKWHQATLLIHNTRTFVSRTQ